MRFGTYMIIGSIIAGWLYGSVSRERMDRCPKERMAIDWTILQLAAVWPALPVLGFYFTGYKFPEPTACKEG